MVSSNNGMLEGPNSPLEELLNAQSEALLAGVPFALRHGLYGMDDSAQAQVTDLTRLAQRLHETLVPVAPREEFLSRLKQDLIGQPAPETTPALLSRWRNLPPRYRVVAGLGGLTITAGLALIAASRVVDRFNRIGRRPQAESDAGLSFHTAT
jgi:hypothetical protein